MSQTPNPQSLSALLADARRLAAFANGDAGGNPAGVVTLQTMPPAELCQAAAAEIGYSETALLHPAPEAGPDAWRIRYFAPEMEVPFCGHATIAAGAVLGAEVGPGRYRLLLNSGEAAVEARPDGSAALTSPPTRSGPADPAAAAEALALFGLGPNDLDPRLVPWFAHAGADHLVLALQDRARLAAMRYDLAEGQRLMRRHGWVTISLIQAETAARIHARNPFASGGVYEDPATGAAAAALGGALRDAGWPFGRPSGDAATQQFAIQQGVDMGAPSHLDVSVPTEPGAGVTVAGRTRPLSS